MMKFAESLPFLFWIPFCVDGFVFLTQIKGSVFVAKHLTTRVETTSLNNVIRGIEEEDLIDEGLGGVRLAIESAILVSGQYDKKADEFTLEELKRYSKLAEIEDPSLLQSSNSTVIGAGLGVECYHDPGTTTTKRIDYAPLEAARDLLKSFDASSLTNAQSLSVNVLGGDELVINEAVEGALEVVRGVELPSKCKVSMRSLCDSSLPPTKASITLVANSGSGSGMSGMKKSIAKGQIYQFDRKFWTVLDEDLKTEEM